MKIIVALFFMLTLAGCGGGGDGAGSAVDPEFLVEVSVVETGTPAAIVRGGSTYTVNMESGQRIVLSAKYPITATVDNFGVDDPRATETSQSWIFNSNVDATIRVQAFPPENRPTAESPVNPPDPSRVVTLIVNLRSK